MKLHLPIPARNSTGEHTALKKMKCNQQRVLNPSVENWAEDKDIWRDSSSRRLYSCAEGGWKSLRCLHLGGTAKDGCAAAQEKKKLGGKGGGPTGPHCPYTWMGSAVGSARLLRSGFSSAPRAPPRALAEV